MPHIIAADPGRWCWSGARSSGESAQPTNSHQCGEWYCQIRRLAV